MMRQIYRVYLYLVSIALLVLATVGLGSLLSTIFAYTTLRGSQRPEPIQQELVQSLVFAITAWIIAGVLGWLHLRLIRRDIAENPKDGCGGVRAFFLNGMEAIGALVAVFSGSAAFSAVAYSEQPYIADTTGTFAMAIASLALVVVLELERRRYSVTTAPAAVFQRLHTFGVPLILLISTVISAWDVAMRTSVATVLMRAGVYSPVDPNACGQNPNAMPLGPCTLPNAGVLWLAALVPLATVALYSLLARNDFDSLIRVVTHIASLCLGLAATLVGLVSAIELALRGAFGLPVGWSDIAHPWSAAYDFVSPLSIGLLLMVGYGLWLRVEKVRLPTGPRTTGLIAEVFAALILAGAFWWGVGKLAYTTLLWLGGVSESFAALWAGALALTISGAPYIALALHLRRSSAQMEENAPRRGFILALLAGGTVTGAVGLTITLYSLGTNLLGAPLANSEEMVRAGLAALLVGAILVTSYGWIALQEHSLAALVKRLKTAMRAPSSLANSAETGTASARQEADVTPALEQVLKEYAAHRIGLNEGTERIKALVRHDSETSKRELAHT